jgi:DNA-binding transcriptional MerR regulator
MERKFSQIAMEFMASEKESRQEQQENVVSEKTFPAEEEMITETKPAGKEIPKKSLSKRGRPSLKEIEISADLIQIPADEILFQKQYYPIGEVAKWFRVNQSLIRYWETEFDILQPRKNRKGDRFFRPVDVKNLLLIYDLIRRRKFTLEGAKDYLKNNKRSEEKFVMIQSLEKLKSFLLELKASL